MSGTRREGRHDKDSSFLDVQRGVRIHYKVYRSIATFRKPAPRKGKGEGEGAGLPVKSSSTQGTDEVNMASTRRTARRREDSDDPELELDVPDEMEELGDRPTVHKPSLVVPSASSTAIIFVLLHGLLGCTSSWDKVVNPLRQYGTVISFDR